MLSESDQTGLAAPPVVHGDCSPPPYTALAQWWGVPPRLTTTQLPSASSSHQRACKGLAPPASTPCPAHQKWPPRTLSGEARGPPGWGFQKFTRPVTP